MIGPILLVEQSELVNKENIFSFMCFEELL